MTWSIRLSIFTLWFSFWRLKTSHEKYQHDMKKTFFKFTRCFFVEQQSVVVKTMCGLKKCWNNVKSHFLRHSPRYLLTSVAPLFLKTTLNKKVINNTALNLCTFQFTNVDPKKTLSTSLALQLDTLFDDWVPHVTSPSRS